MSEICENIARIRSVSDKYGALLCAVIKTRTCEEVDTAIKDGGITAVGENRVQELLFHYETVRSSGAKLHFIGQLQKNKVKYIADKVDMIESLDSLSLASEIEKQAAKIGRVINCLIEINIGREEQKGGIMPEELAHFLTDLEKYPHIHIRGLMTVAPKCDDIAGYDAYFSETAALFSYFKERFPEETSPVLSMGMSGNYERALAYGSTEIRIGTGIFGERRQ